jgi:pimeloyl-ACP methyl ester carboxylesterase
MKKSLLMAALLAFWSHATFAQDLSGDWQGSLGNGPNPLRLVLRLSKSDTNWHGRLIAIDQDWGGIQLDALTVQGTAITFTAPEVGGRYDGALAAGGASITGTWTQGQPRPLTFGRPTAQSTWKDPSPHETQFITVDQGVQLEVLDWGGPPNARTLVLVPGLGNTAHVFDQFAATLTPHYHIYGVTRRGFGASSTPASGYSADRLGDDVLAVLEALKIGRPVLVGHSLGGEELSSVGSRHPERVAGLVYLDAGYAYAFYDRSVGDYNLDLADVERKLAQLDTRTSEPTALIQELLDTALPAMERDLREAQKSLTASPGAWPPVPPITRAITMGMQKYTSIPVPILAIYAVPHAATGTDAAALAAEARDAARTGAQADAFAAAMPSARVVRLAHADHYVFRSNEADVLREMNTFIDGLK